MAVHYDVAILGGGLAGGCLARQLRLEAPDLRVLVVEKRPHPVREAAFKVGESSVEIGAHYFQKRLGLEPHLRSAQLEKLGLRYFFTHGDNRDITNRVELGPPQFPPVPSFQLDRGRLENFLLRANARAAARRCSTAVACRLDRARRRGAIAYQCHGADGARDVTRTLGRRRQRPRRAAEAAARPRPPEHARRQRLAGCASARACASTTGPTIRRWQARVPSGLRWLSTNHLMGPGYWVWLIPLGSGSTSFGIVADGDMHPFHRINRFERAMDWLREFEPQCARGHGGACRPSSRIFSRCSTSRTAARACSRRIAGRSSAKPACSPIRSTRRDRTSSPWATTTSPT